MEIDIYKLDKGINIDEDISLDLSKYPKTDIVKIDKLHIIGTLKLNIAEELKIDLVLTGIMYFKDSVSLEIIEYPFTININEEYDINTSYFKENYQKNQNTLDILPILWENIVLEIPISLTKTKDVVIKGEGWSLGNIKND